MKKIIPYLLVILFATSCKKMDLSTFRDEIRGEWEYIRWSGYGIPLPALPAGNGRIIEFGSGVSFTRRQHDTVLFKGVYSLEKRKDCSGDDKPIFVSTNDPDFPSGYIIRRSGDSLYISTPNCLSDGGSGIYRKL